MFICARLFMTKFDETWETTVVEDRDDLDFRGAQNVKRYFIDGVNGNDSNSGTSVNAAWKTMSNFISRTDKGVHAEWQLFESRLTQPSPCCA